MKDKYEKLNKDDYYKMKSLCYQQRSETRNLSYFNLFCLFISAMAFAMVKSFRDIASFFMIVFIFLLAAQQILGFLELVKIKNKYAYPDVDKWAASEPVPEPDPIKVDNEKDFLEAVKNGKDGDVLHYYEDNKDEAEKIA